MKFNAAFFIPFDSFNFHLPRFFTREKRQRKKKERKKGERKVARDRIRGPDTKVKLSKAFCDLG